MDQPRYPREQPAEDGERRPPPRIDPRRERTDPEFDPAEEPPSPDPAERGDIP
jgi:hypothetical protein